MYELYADPKNSLGDVMRYLSERGMGHLRGGAWSAARISDMLRSPIYVKADADVYDFFKRQGANMVNPVSDFTGYNACYLYRGAVSKSRKQCDLKDKEIVLAPHEGIVSSRDWIACRARCLKSRQSTMTCKGKNSWLLGKVKCGRCGGALTIAKADTKWHRYFICATSLATKKEKCAGTGGTVYADVLEEYIFGAIGERLSEFPVLTPGEHLQSREANENKIRISEIGGEIDDLMSRLGSADDILIGYISDKIKALDTERARLQEANSALARDSHGEITDHVTRWNYMRFEDRKAVADVLINIITISDGKIEIAWNI